MIKILKDKKAITLIALVITIVVLVILAVVTISLTVGNDGLISRALKAAKSYNDAQERDKESINDLYGQLSIAADGTISGLTVESLKAIIDERIDEKTADLQAENATFRTEIDKLKQEKEYGYFKVDDVYELANQKINLVKSNSNMTFDSTNNEIKLSKGKKYHICLTTRTCDNNKDYGKFCLYNVANSANLISLDWNSPVNWSYQTKSIIYTPANDINVSLKHSITSEGTLDRLNIVTLTIYEI